MAERNENRRRCAIYTLKELLADIESGAVDIVVVYKIDRLSRSITDFTDISKIFERYGVSFVSVTQQIDTSSAPGRMMLNILMSFAQFEREMTSDRIRDKIYATRKRGLWSGGATPFGYRLVNDLAVSVAMGTDWLGFTCTAGKVLIIDNELHKETTADRVPRTIEARGFDIKKVGERLFVENQRGHLKSVDQLDERKAALANAQPALMDALNAPSEIADTSWIKPGKVLRVAKLDTGVGKAAVDFVKRNGMQYVGSQEWRAWVTDAIRAAAKRRLMVDIHDEYRLTGIQNRHDSACPCFIIHMGDRRRPWPHDRIGA